MKLYHISSVSGLKVLVPKKSTHGVPYVYATENLEMGLLFGSSKSYGDFDGSYGAIEGKPYFYEAYPGALERRFKNEKCYIYEVDPTTFESGKTSFDAEVVSEKPVKVLKETKVDDLYALLLSLAQHGKFDYKKYDGDNPEYVAMMNAHIKDRISGFGILNRRESRTYKFCMQKFPKLMQEVEQESFASK